MFPLIRNSSLRTILISLRTKRTDSTSLRLYVAAELLLLPFRQHGTANRVRTVDNAYGTHFYFPRCYPEIMHDNYADISYEHPNIVWAGAAGHRYCPAGHVPYSTKYRTPRLVVLYLYLFKISKHLNLKLLA